MAQNVKSIEHTHICIYMYTCTCTSSAIHAVGTCIPAGLWGPD